MKLVFISTMLPSGHYSQYLTKGLCKCSDIELIVYSTLNEEKFNTNEFEVKQIWRKNIYFIVDILKELKKDRPEIVHIQHEFNMYGGIITAILFPFLVALIKLRKIKVVTTIHAAISKKQVSNDFIKMFYNDSILIKPFIVRIFFSYIYNGITVFSDAVIVHTFMAKDFLVNCYNAKSSNIFVIPAAIPEKNINNKNQEKYFLYFGYMSRRKGIEFLIKGFKDFLEASSDNYKLILAGGIIKGQEVAFQEIQQLIADTLLQDKIIIKGFIDETEQDNLYSNAYAVVIPAKLSMGSSGPLYHSSSYGKVALCSKVGHFLEDVINMKTGILVDNNNWGEAFLYAVNNPEKIKELEENIVKKAKARTPVITAQKHIQECY
jgi:glycosyltransferase involved in cell wall biosynthesis